MKDSILLVLISLLTMSVVLAEQQKEPEELVELFQIRLRKDRNNVLARWELLLGEDWTQRYRVEMEDISFGGKNYTMVYLFVPIEWEERKTLWIQKPVPVISFCYEIRRFHFKENKNPQIIPRVSRTKEHASGEKVYELLLYRNFVQEQWDTHKFEFLEFDSLFSSKEA